MVMMYVKQNGEMVYLWRVVDQEGEILESYITRTRDKEAAMTFMKKALKRRGSPERITTDWLRSCWAAMIELDKAAKQQAGRWANCRISRVEVAHCLTPHTQSPVSANRRRVAIRPTTLPGTPLNSIK